MKKTERRRIGDLGESIACKYLENKGYIIVTRNYWKSWGEIDIVARHSDGVHFVEVKTVTRETGTEGNHYRPEDNIHQWKLERLTRTIQTYILENKVEDWKFDVVTVYLNTHERKARVEMLENVIIE